MRKPKHSKSRLAAKERRIHALELRKHGYTYSQIAKELRCSQKTAIRYLERAAADLAEHDRQLASVVVSIELAKLDEMDRHVHEIIMGCKDPDICLRAIDRRIRIQERRAKLQGLDSPDKVEQVGSEVIQVVFDDGSAIDGGTAPDDGAIPPAREPEPGS